MLKQQLDQLKADKSKILDSSEHQIFSACNNFDNVHLFIDLHGQSKKSASEIVSRRLIDVDQMLQEGRFTPNIDENNHVFKIICGAGHHSERGRAQLKHLIPVILRN
jgi:hypothetical protein